MRREPVERRPARVAEPEQPGSLVERLAGGVVERLAEDRVARGRVVDPRDERVPAARDQAEERRLDRRVAERGGEDVALEVVDRNQRQLACRGKAFA